MIMKIYFFSTPHFDIIRTQFINSIKDDWELKEHRLDNFSTQNDLGGGMPALFSRMHIIFSAFEETKENEVFLVSDLDVVFYAKCTEQILDCIDNRHMCFQRELQDSGINIGFMAIRNTKETKNFWQDINTRLEKRDVSIKDGGSKELEGIIDQYLVNILLHENYHPEVNWSLFPNSFWNWSQGMTNSYILNKKIVLHHANCAIGIEDKIKQFEYINKLMQN